MGKANSLSVRLPKFAKTSLLHAWWDSFVLHERPIILAPIFSNAALDAWHAPSSVVQTGVKSFGCEKRMVQGLPGRPLRKECNEESPFVVFIWKSGMLAPILNACPPE